MKPKVAFGVPFYGGVPGEWWVQLVEHVAHAAVHEIEYGGMIASGTMTTDHNRNLIADEFLKGDAEWLFWIDSDTVVPIGSLTRMLGLGKTMVSGLYYGKNDPYPPIAYVEYNGAFTPIDKFQRWERGEILPVDATGFGCMLTHRSVFEDIKANYEVYQRPGGSLTVVHKNDIIGEIKDGDKETLDEKVYKGQFRTRLKKPILENLRFPFFIIEHMRTEDMFFFDIARRVGHKPWLDTSIECSHLRWKGFSGKDYREIYGH